MKIVLYLHYFIAKILSNLVFSKLKGRSGIYKSPTVEATQTRVCEEARRHTEKSKADMLSAADALRRTLREKYAYEPKADSSSPEIVTYSRAWRGTPYVFALNDRRTFGDYVGQWGLTMEKGLPFSGNVTLNNPDGRIGAVYELSRGGELQFRRLADGRVEVPLSYETNDGRLLLFLERKIAKVEVTSCRRGCDICVTMTVRDETGEPVPARLPTRTRPAPTNTARRRRCGNSRAAANG